MLQTTNEEEKKNYFNLPSNLMTVNADTLKKIEQQAFV